MVLCVFLFAHQLQAVETTRSDLPQNDHFWQILWQIGYLHGCSVAKPVHVLDFAFFTRSAISCAVSIPAGLSVVRQQFEIG
jgi:hypothetical protein